MKKFNFQLYERLNGKIIRDSGGVVYVTGADDAAKATLMDKDGASESNALSLTNGGATFYTANSITSLDLYIMTPGGQFIVEKGITPGEHDLYVDVQQRHQCMVIPFSMDDLTANTETDTGFDEPSNAIMLPDAAIRVVTVDATETIDVGTDSTDSGDANGFIAAASVANAAVVNGTIANGSNTLGALFEVQDSANAGDLTHEGHISGGKSITLTTSAGSDTAEGFIYLPYLLCN